MASFETVGVLKLKKDTQVVSEKFSKREFVVTLDASTQFPQHVSFQVTQDKCSILDKFKAGQEVKVHFNLRGREWNGPDGTRYFNTLEAWRIEAVGSASIETVKAEVMPAQEIADDLPF